MTTEPQKLSGQLGAAIPAVGPVAPTLTFGDKKPLRLRTGMNIIEWVYELKTQSQATYGGEVVQVLGASVGPIRISGSTQSRQEYETIRKWFGEVMRVLGTGNRRETPVIFNYAERDWSFQIMPIEFGPWQLDDKIVAAEWFLTAEVVSPTANGLVEHSMADANVGIPDSALLAQSAYDHWLNRFEPTSANEYFPTFDEVEEQGNSMDRMLASLARGAFDLFGRPEAATDEPDDVYEEITGSKWIRPPANEAAGVTASTTGVGGFPDDNDVTVKGVAATEEQLRNANVILTVGVENSAPDNVLISALMAATQESVMGLEPSNGTHFGLFHMDLDKGTEAENRDPRYASVWYFTRANNNGGAIGYARQNPSWTTGQIAEAVEISGNGSAYMDWESEATNTLEEWRKGGTSGAASIASVTETGEALSNAILNHPRFNGGDSNNPLNDIRNYQSAGVQEKTLKIMLAILNGGWNIRLSVIKAGHTPGSQHERGKAFDCNNYGPTGAGSGGAIGVGGNGTASNDTSSTDPTAFVSFLKANRAALGDIHILGGAGQAKWGTDAADQDHHIHISWGSEDW